MDRSHKNKVQELDDQSKTCRPPDKVTIQELNKTIKLKNNKAPGPDKIPNEIFINANQTIQSYDIPDQWQVGEITRLQGKGKWHKRKMLQ